MHNKALAYNLQGLRFYTKKNYYNAEHMAILTEYLKEENQEKICNKKYSKDELYLIGFNAFQINRFFKPVSENLFRLKSAVCTHTYVYEFCFPAGQRWLFP